MAATGLPWNLDGDLLLFQAAVSLCSPLCLDWCIGFGLEPVAKVVILGVLPLSLEGLRSFLSSDLPTLSPQWKATQASLWGPEAPGGEPLAKMSSQTCDWGHLVPGKLLDDSSSMNDPRENPAISCSAKLLSH